MNDKPARPRPRFLAIFCRVALILIALGILAVVSEIMLMVREAERNPVVIYVTNTTERVVVQAAGTAPPQTPKTIPGATPKAAPTGLTKEDNEVAVKQVIPREPDFDWSKILTLSRLRVQAESVFQPSRDASSKAAGGAPPAKGAQSRIDSPYVSANAGNVPNPEEAGKNATAPGGFAPPDARAGKQKGAMLISLP